MRRPSILATSVATIALSLGSCAADTSAPSPGNHQAPSTESPIADQIYRISIGQASRSNAGSDISLPTFDVEVVSPAAKPGAAAQTEALLSSMVTQIINEAEAASVGSAETRRRISIGAKALDQNGPAASLLLVTETNYGGITSSTPTGVVLDLNEGRRVKFDELFGPATRLDAIMSVLDTSLSAEAKRRGFAPGFPAPIPPGYAADLIVKDHWYTKSDGFHILVPEGMIAPISDGTIDITIPWDRIESLETDYARSAWKR